MISRACGRSTKSGQPCRNLFPCRAHWKEDDQLIIDAWNEAWNAAYQAGIRSGRSMLLSEQDQQRRQERSDANRRYADSGKQIVEVDHRYAYTWDGAEPLAVGDQVVLPSNWLIKHESDGRVTGLGTTYDGALSAIARKINNPQPNHRTDAA